MVNQSPDSGAIEKPSFLSFLKLTKQKEKESQKGSKKRNKKSNDLSTQSSDGGNSPDKSQVRRAQVRRAQIEHRQRKANYVKQMELDVSQLRELITVTQRDTDALKEENDAIRNLLLSQGVPHPPSLSPSRSATQITAASSVFTSPHPNTQQQSPESKPSSSVAALDQIATDDDLKVTLSLDKTMGTPSFSITPISRTKTSQTPQPQPWLTGAPLLTPAQEHTVINFILALEHCCWDHFWIGDCHHHLDDSEEVKGHTLMASSYLMANAPNDIYEQRKAFTSIFRSSPTLQWQASPVTLYSLHGLAQTLNTGDYEVAPVQAWFELARRYPIDLLLDPSTLETLKREFRGIARCVVYGAAIERVAFESVVARVLGPPTNPNSALH